MRLAITLAFFAGLGAGLCSAQQLKGIIDIHTHGDPDSAPRKIDVLDLAKLAEQEGMRAIVLKNHYAPTAQVAYLVNKLVPGVQSFGAVSLDRAVGGVNPEAVAQAAAFKGHLLRVVWMPTFDSENDVKFNKRNQPWVAVSKNGQLLPEVIEVLKLIAKLDVALATGHSTAEEDLMLIREAKKQGIRKIVVTHPTQPLINMKIPQMQEAAMLGAYLELCAGQVLPSPQGQSKLGETRLGIPDFVRVIHSVGAEHVILSSDLGQPANPVHTEGWKTYLTMLKQGGITDKEIDLMARHNPAKLLGLE